MRTLLLTGFPGLLGSALLPRLLRADGGLEAICLVQERYLPAARSRVGALATVEPGLARRIRLEPGDITRPGLGLEAPASVARQVRQIHHLAALYDVTATRERAHRVNVEGTRNVLDFAGSCPRLERLHYMSTCYVSGRRPGVVREDELEGAGPFNNVYEETKHHAEVAVRARMDAGLPATVYRPAIVVGDSRTGRTRKYDGPYFVIRFLDRQPGVALMPMVGEPRRTRVNVVPLDFVADAMAHLAGLDASKGRAYHLADPDPLTVDGMLREVARGLGKPVLRIPLPGGLVRRALEVVPGLERWAGVPAEALDYFTHPARYDPSNTLRDLEGSGIRVPRFGDYVDILVDFVRRNPDVRPDAMA